jgi:hypothetical protein
MHGDAFAKVTSHEDDSADAPLVSVKRTQELLGGITRKEVENMNNRGEIESIKLGRRRMVIRKSIDALIQRKLAEARARRAAA